jgi:GNAT superfamily N-acetyltransferase
VINEVPPSQIETYRTLFSGPHAELVAASIAAGNTAARLWVSDQLAAGAVVLLWDKGNNVFYLGGAPVTDDVQRELATFIAAHIRPAALVEGRTRFKARALAPKAALAQIFGEIDLKEAHTLFYASPNVPPNATPAPAIGGLRFTGIDRALLANEHLENIAHVRSEIRWMWPSEERFYEQGFGVAAVVEERAICWCTAEYVSAQRCGIGIATDPAYERRGVATATAARFIRDAQQRGIVPYWECASWNSASMRVAQKLGFELIAEERYSTGAFA